MTSEDNFFDLARTLPISSIVHGRNLGHVRKTVTVLIYQPHILGELVAIGENY